MILQDMAGAWRNHRGSAEVLQANLAFQIAGALNSMTNLTETVVEVPLEETEAQGAAEEALTNEILLDKVWMVDEVFREVEGVEGLVTEADEVEEETPLAESEIMGGIIGGIMG